MKLVFGHDKAVAEWVGRRIMGYGDFGPCVAIGVADGNTPIAGIVYHMWAPDFRTMQVSMAADSPRWAQRGIIRAMLHYPFEQQGVRKLWSVIASNNERALKFNKGIGFRQEAMLYRHFGEHNAIVTRMFDKDYHRLYGEANGQQEGRIAASSA